MGQTAISWTATALPDGTVLPGYSFNPWIGCTKVSQGCKLCYAETQNKHYNWNPEGWGPGVPRKRTSEANWKKPIQWAKQAAKDGVTRRVFCASLADVFDDEVDPKWREDLFMQIGWIEIHYPGSLEWLILTKRIESVSTMFPFDWGTFLQRCIRLGVTTEDQENADKRIPQLLNVWKGKTFLSVEPMIGPLKLFGFGSPTWGKLPESAFIQWVICGGESGAGCRPMSLDWARDLRRQCADASVPFFFKQLGGFPDKFHDPAGWPEELRAQEFPK
jgi:protein gp37